MFGALAQTQSHIHAYIQADRGIYRDIYSGTHIIHWHKHSRIGSHIHIHIHRIIHTNRQAGRQDKQTNKHAYVYTHNDPYTHTV